MTKDTRRKILIVDDEPSVLNSLKRTLRKEHDVILSQDGFSAIQVLNEQEIAVIIADQRMPKMNGVTLLEKAMEIQPDTARILVTGYSDIQAVIDAINEGNVYYYIHKPWEPEDVRLIIRQAIDRYNLIQTNRSLVAEIEETNRRLSDENLLLIQDAEKRYSFDQIIGESPIMNDVFILMRKVIPTDTTVLILGETGTGKELVARAIHTSGPRKTGMFVPQNCAALPDTLLESALFGHKKGAFTDAVSDKKGLFQMADGGTIFLDEITDTSKAFQQRLLRVLQEGEIHPLGSDKAVKVDVRVISASQKDLGEEVKQGRFRADLFYRLNVFPVTLPTLRERHSDIPILIEHFLRVYSQRLGKKINGISQEVLSSLMVYPFPGNVRELENIIERAVVLAKDGSTLTEDQISLHSDQPLDFNLIFPGEEDKKLKSMVEALEKKAILQALQRWKGNISKAAKSLGLSRPGLYQKIDRYEIKM
ncbi:MAG: sigma-54 dependent transcriptional regulator [Candidatus Marinimicrobia bacterium]|nr:sigma-54 dependent transcriptional regulator [Candidatus Neomarinimicrobiota bacterium]